MGGFGVHPHGSTTQFMTNDAHEIHVAETIPDRPLRVDYFLQVVQLWICTVQGIFQKRYKHLLECLAVTGTSSGHV